MSDWKKRQTDSCPTKKEVAVVFENGYMVPSGFYPAEDYDWSSNNGEWNIAKYLER